jgi:prophage tail gpP-like protein
MNEVYLIVNGQKYGGWKEVSITLSMETLSGKFDLGLTERWPGQNVSRSINLMDSCEVRIGGETVITGYVDDIAHSYDGTSHSFKVSGRDKAGDLVDCSAVQKPGQWKNQRLEQIAGDLVAPFDRMSVQTEADTGEPFKTFALEQGESVLEAIERMSKLRGLLVISDGKGNLLITRSGTQQAQAALITGQNILKGEGRFSSKDRFSEVTVKGQTEGSDEMKPDINTKPNAQAKDSEVSRYRPLLMLAEGQANTQTCQKRVDWEIATRRAKGFELTYTVAGWTQGANGPLWRLNRLVRVQDSIFKVNENLLVAGLTFTLDGQGGRLTEIKLARPESFSPKPTE